MSRAAHPRTLRGMTSSRPSRRLCPLSTDRAMKGCAVRHNVISKPVRHELNELASRLDKARPVTIGYPGAFDLDYRPLSTFFERYLLNNVGDPTTDGTWPYHTKAMEREV